MKSFGKVCSVIIAVFFILSFLQQNSSKILKEPEKLSTRLWNFFKNFQLNFHLELKDRKKRDLYVYQKIKF